MCIKPFQSCPTLFSLTDSSPQGSAAHGILQAGILEQVAALLQGVFPTQGSNPRLRRCQADSSPRAAWDSQSPRGQAPHGPARASPSCPLPALLGARHPTVALTCPPLQEAKVERIFICVLPSYIFLIEMSLHVFCPCFNYLVVAVVVFLLLCFECFYAFLILVLCCIYGTCISPTCLFIFLTATANTRQLNSQEGSHKTSR